MTEMLMAYPVWVWPTFTLFLIFMLYLDLALLNRGDHEIGIRRSLWLTAMWIALALVFFVILIFWRSTPEALQFLSGYLIEKALSVDNLFVFLLLFNYFQVPRRYQHKVLFWGIVGAVVLRAIFIFAGVALIHRFHFVIYIFGAILILTAIKMALIGEREIDPGRSLVLRAARRLMPFSPHYDGGRFFTRDPATHKLLATPLLLVLITVEATDVVFAVDSIPAIFAISQDPFIILTSNVFAILGLRALFFALSGIMNLFRFLDKALCLVLAFVGVKMLISDVYHIPIGISLGAIAALLTGGIVASLIWPIKDPSELIVLEPGSEEPPPVVKELIEDP